jgi:hypothetical protein
MSQPDEKTASLHLLPALSCMSGVPLPAEVWQRIASAVSALSVADLLSLRFVCRAAAHAVVHVHAERHARVRAEFGPRKFAVSPGIVEKTILVHVVPPRGDSLIMFVDGNAKEENLNDGDTNIQAADTEDGGDRSETVLDLVWAKGDCVVKTPLRIPGFRTTTSVSNVRFAPGGHYVAMLMTIDSAVGDLEKGDPIGRLRGWGKVNVGESDLYDTYFEPSDECALVIAELQEDEDGLPRGIQIYVFGHAFVPEYGFDMQWRSTSSPIGRPELAFAGVLHSAPGAALFLARWSQFEETADPSFSFIGIFPGIAEELMQDKRDAMRVCESTRSTSRIELSNDLKSIFFDTTSKFGVIRMTHTSYQANRPSALMQTEIEHSASLRHPFNDRESMCTPSANRASRAFLWRTIPPTGMDSVQSKIETDSGLSALASHRNYSSPCTERLKGSPDVLRSHLPPWLKWVSVSPEKSEAQEIQERPSIVSNAGVLQWKDTSSHDTRSTSPSPAPAVGVRSVLQRIKGLSPQSIRLPRDTPQSLKRLRTPHRVDEGLIDDNKNVDGSLCRTHLDAIQSPNGCAMSENSRSECRATHSDTHSSTRSVSPFRSPRLLSRSTPDNVQSPSQFRRGCLRRSIEAQRMSHEAQVPEISTAGLPSAVSPVAIASSPFGLVRTPPRVTRPPLPALMSPGKRIAFSKSAFAGTSPRVTCMSPDGLKICSVYVVKLATGTEMASEHLKCIELRSTEDGKVILRRVVRCPTEYPDTEGAVRIRYEKSYEIVAHTVGFSADSSLVWVRDAWISRNLCIFTRRLPSVFRVSDGSSVQRFSRSPETYSHLQMAPDGLTVYGTRFVDGIVWVDAVDVLCGDLIGTECIAGPMTRPNFFNAHAVYLIDNWDVRGVSRGHVDTLWEVTRGSIGCRWVAVWPGE